MKCDRCGHEMQVGDWPFCHGDQSEHAPGGRYGFDPFTPYLDPNIQPNGPDVAVVPTLGRPMRGTWISSREQRRALMKANNLDWAPRDSETGGREF